MYNLGDYFDLSQTNVFFFFHGPACIKMICIWVNIFSYVIEYALLFS